MTISLPLFVMLPRKTKADKRIALNMNIYRNLHHHVNDQAKKAFKDAISSDLLVIPQLEKISLTYILYPATKRLVDVSNPCSIIDKFFCDALVSSGRLPEDHHQHLIGVSYWYGHVDKTNPRCDVTITIEE